MGMPQTNELPKLTSKQIAVFERYARLEITLDDLRRALPGLVEYNFERRNRWIDQHFRIPDPGITITREHVQNALTKKRMDQFSGHDLICWASMLLMSDVYDFDARDEDFIGDSLTDISYGDIAR